MSLSNNWEDIPVNFKSGAELYSLSYEEAAHKRSLKEEATHTVATQALESLEEGWEMIQVGNEASATSENLGSAKVLSLVGGAGSSIYFSGVGAAIAETVGGMAVYMTAVPADSGLLAQYFGAITAGNVAAPILNFTIFGVSAATVANLAAAVSGGVMVAKACEAGYNRFIAHSEEEKVSIGFPEIAKEITSKIWK